jgi:hypothetical protein
LFPPQPSNAIARPTDAAHTVTRDSSLRLGRIATHF